MSNDVLRLFTPVHEPSVRERELSLLMREYEEAKASGRPRIVFVRGAKGVGKSWLMARLTTSMEHRGVPVFEGGSAREVRRTWGVVSPLVNQVLAAARRLGVPEGKVGSLATLLAPLRSSAIGGRVEDRRLAVFEASCELVTLAGRMTPVFIWPDLDRADRASLELLRYIIGVVSTPESKAGGLFVLTFRDETALPEALAEMLARVSGRTLALSGLDLDGIRSFLAQGEVAQKLLEATGGNPESLGNWLDRPPVPAADFVLRRIERLSKLQRAVLQTLAASPEPLSVEMLSEVMSAEPASTAAVLDALLRERLTHVRVIDGRPVWHVAREVEGQALRTNVAPEAAVEMARQLGRVLAAHGSLVAAAELLLDVAPAEAVEIGTEAARGLVQRGALEDASDLYARVHRLAQGEGRGELAASWSSVLAALGSSRRAARRMLEAARLGAAAQSATRQLEAAKLLLKAGRWLSAEKVLASASKHLVDAPEVKAVAVELALLQGNASEAAKRCGAWLAAHEADTKVSFDFRNVFGKALLVLGQADQALGVFAYNAVWAESQGLTAESAGARLNEGVAAYKKGDRARAIVCWESVPPRDRRQSAVAHANLGSLYAESGDFELALDHLTQALDAFSRYAQGRDVVLAASNLARLQHFLGDLDRAAELAEHALGVARVLQETYLEATAQLTLGAVRLDQKQGVEAQRRLGEARALFERIGNDGYASLSAALKARAHLSLSERAQAEVELGRRCIEKGVRGVHAAMLEVELTRADLCLLHHDLLGASRAASRAREALLDHPDLEGPARTYFLMGRLRLAAADSSGAQAEFQRANRSLDELVQRVPPVRRTAFLSIARRAEIVATAEPELRLPRVTASLTPRVSVDRQFGFVGRSPSLMRITKQLEPIGKSNTTVLIRGESGTGKELLAEALHQMSPRRHMPLVKVNCGAMVEELLLSELFGHERGAFTGAMKERKGRFEMADGGTIFLDEIGDISPKAQVALLRVLQEREFERVGGNRTLKVDVRVICATNRELEALIAQGRFRGDLYYRLKGVMLELPPLRERLEDLPMLAQHFLDLVAKEQGEPARRVSEEAMALLARHSWPGNIREFENVVRSAAIFAEGAVVAPDAFSHVAELRALLHEDTKKIAHASQSTPQPLASPPGSPSESTTPWTGGTALSVDYYEMARQRGISLKELRQEIETQCIQRALFDAKGNISEAARLLKMKRSRLSQIVNATPGLKAVTTDGSNESDEEE